MTDKDDTPIWTCKDGRKIPVPKLEEEHLVNIINMWRRNIDEYRRRVERAYDDAYEDSFISLQDIPMDLEGYETYLEGYEAFPGGEEGMLLELEDDDFLRATFPVFSDLLWECISRGLMDGDSGEWLREPELRSVNAFVQLELARRIIECGIRV